VASTVDSPAGTRVEQLDVVIVGAGISGVGAACYLASRLPQKSFAILEERECSGGTWDLFRYPGIRSDSDLHTYAYAFKPWLRDEAIADGPAILAYLREAARENGVDEHIRYRQRVLSASWSSENARWTVNVQPADGEAFIVQCSWLFIAAGYFRYDQGYLPHFEGLEQFAGPVVHPQHWPEDLDYAGRRVVIIGSGATAVTLLPAMAERAAHVTMLQRSPSYIISLPRHDPIAGLLARVLPARRAYELTRRKNVWLQRNLYRLSRSRPGLVRRLLRRGVERRLPPDFDVDTHFTPTYDPWDQRLCAVPDGDMFAAISEGRASVVTDHISRFTETGILLESGNELPADIVVTATGLDLQALGGIDVDVDGVPVDLADSLVYKSAMLSDVPNLAFVFGYTNSSWTLKVDLVCDYVCRVIAFMDERRYDACVPTNGDPQMQTRPFLDFSAGYVQRALDRFPRQGTGPWEVLMSYRDDVRRLRDGAVDDGVLRFSRAAVPADTVLAGDPS